MSKLKDGTLDLIYSAMKLEEYRCDNYYQFAYSREDFSIIPDQVREEQEESYRALKSILKEHGYTGKGVEDKSNRTATQLLTDALDHELLTDGFNTAAGFQDRLRHALVTLVIEYPKVRPVSLPFSI